MLCKNFVVIRVKSWKIVMWQEKVKYQSDVVCWVGRHTWSKPLSLPSLRTFRTVVRNWIQLRTVLDQIQILKVLPAIKEPSFSSSCVTYLLFFGYKGYMNFVVQTEIWTEQGQNLRNTVILVEANAEVPEWLPSGRNSARMSVHSVIAFFHSS